MANASSSSSLDHGQDISSNMTYNDECCLKTALAFVVLRQRLARDASKEKSNDTIVHADSSDQVTKESLPFLSNIFGRQDSKASATTTVSLSKPSSTSSSISSILPASAGNHHLQRMMRVAIATAMPLYKQMNNHDHQTTDTPSTWSKPVTTGTPMTGKSTGVPNKITPPSQNKINETSRKRHHETRAQQEQSPYYYYQNHRGWVYDYERTATTTNRRDISMIYTTLEGLTSHLALQLRRMIANNNNRGDFPTTSKEPLIPSSPSSSSSLQTWIRNTFISMSWQNTSNSVPTCTSADKTTTDGTTSGHSTSPNSQTPKLQKAKSKHNDNDDTTTTHDNNVLINTSQTMMKNSPVQSPCETITISPVSILTMCTIWHGIVRHEDDATGKLTFLVMKVIGQLLQDLYNDLFQYNTNDSQTGNQPEVPKASRMSFSCNNHNCTTGSTTPPRIADVLAVNLIHLLEGVVSWRYQQKQAQHHHYRCYGGGRTSPTTTTTTAQEELIVELQTIFGSEIWLPISFPDMAHFYYTQKRQRQQQQHQQNQDDHHQLTPSGKIMLRLSLYDVMQKISTCANY